MKSVIIVYHAKPDLIFKKENKLRKGKYEEEKNRLAKVEAFLIRAIKESMKGQASSAAAENYEKAELYKRFKDVLAEALSLCGELHITPKESPE